MRAVQLQRLIDVREFKILKEFKCPGFHKKKKKSGLKMSLSPVRPDVHVCSFEV